jgi:hypothetical protein
MTTQTKRFIELSDIIGLQLECKKCGISLLVGGETLTASLVDPHNMTLSKCPTCDTPWTVPDSYPTVMGYDTEVKKFLRMIELIRSIEEKLGCRIRFELKDDASLGRASGSKA